MATSAALNDQATQALQKSRIPALRRIRIEENGSALVLSGRVPTYYYKQLAQETVLPYLAGRELINRVTVVPRDS